MRAILAISPNHREYIKYRRVAYESMEDLNRERLVLLCLGIPTLFSFARFKGKRTPDKILSSLFVIVNRSYI